MTPGHPPPPELLDDGRVPGAGLLACAEPSTAPRKPATGSTRPPAPQPKCLHDEEIMDWVTPSRHARVLPAFDPAGGSRPPATCLYLVTESRSAASPLIAGLTDLRHPRRAAPRRSSPGGRLDPPMVLVLDDGREHLPPSPTCPTSTPISGAGALIPVHDPADVRAGRHGLGRARHGGPVGPAPTKEGDRRRPSTRPGSPATSPVLVGHHDVPVRSIKRRRRAAPASRSPSSGA